MNFEFSVWDREEQFWWCHNTNLSCKYFLSYLFWFCFFRYWFQFWAQIFGHEFLLTRRFWYNNSQQLSTSELWIFHNPNFKTVYIQQQTSSTIFAAVLRLLETSNEDQKVKNWFQIYNYLLHAVTPIESPNRMGRIRTKGRRTSWIRGNRKGINNVSESTLTKEKRPWKFWKLWWKQQNIWTWSMTRRVTQALHTTPLYSQIPLWHFDTGTQAL